MRNASTSRKLSQPSRRIWRRATRQRRPVPSRKTTTPVKFIVLANHEARPSESSGSLSWQMSAMVGWCADCFMTGNRLFARHLKGMRDVWPRVVGFDELASGAAQLPPPSRVIEERDYFTGKRVRIIRRD